VTCASEVRVTIGKTDTGWAVGNFPATDKRSCIELIARCDDEPGHLGWHVSKTNVPVPGGHVSGILRWFGTIVEFGQRKTWKQRYATWQMFRTEK